VQLDDSNGLDARMGLGPWMEPMPSGRESPRRLRSPVSAQSYTPATIPTAGEAATEALQFKTLHPTYDGRGVAIGSSEFINPVPSLAWACPLQGARFQDSRIPDAAATAVIIEAIPQGNRAA